MSPDFTSLTVEQHAGGRLGRADVPGKSRVLISPLSHEPLNDMSFNSLDDTAADGDETSSHPSLLFDPHLLRRFVSSGRPQVDDGFHFTSVQSMRRQGQDMR
ncbi:unnamed protein product [Linum trigynum]